MKFLPVLLLLALTPLLPAQEFQTGQPLTVADLAKQLNVQTWTLVYQPGKEFSDVHCKLIYRSRESQDAEFTEHYLTAFRRQIQSPVKEFPFTICIDKTRSTLIFDTGSCSGKGVDFGGSLGVCSLPLKDANGRNVLLTAYFPQKSPTDAEVIKGTLELEISAQ